ncbi:Gfo/Idh/MocA family protein [Microbacterium sp. JZ31]|uniref:Gfo/Idh/MocA family protein n=1 Tax=Microbacterium sp. JZ31 TaxID=1906274 RepID=UPI001933D684|nr:Gfo/Idh/MocA family oxidoreductase [Microbacterium sp. JZ31]
MTDTAIRWGILAPGSIADSFAADLAVTPGAELVAVASRDAERSAAFAARHGAARSYASYDELLAADDIDVVYIASPHALHHEQATRALEAGKHVLCEKPLTLDRTLAASLIETARTHDRFLMEGMWMACNPVILDLRARLAAGEFGAPRHLFAEFAFRVDAGPEHRLLNPALGGGALLDVGVYPLTLAHILLGEALQLRATGVTDAVDLDVAIAGRYPDDAVASLAVGLTRHAPIAARLSTDAGWIDIPDFFAPTHFTFHPSGGAAGGEPLRFDPPQPLYGRGFGNEAAEVARCLRAELRESPLVPHAQTLAILGQIDRLRADLAGTAA